MENIRGRHYDRLAGTPHGFKTNADVAPNVCEAATALHRAMHLARPSATILVWRDMIRGGISPFEAVCE